MSENPYQPPTGFNSNAQQQAGGRTRLRTGIRCSLAWTGVCVGNSIAFAIMAKPWAALNTWISFGSAWLLIYLFGLVLCAVGHRLMTMVNVGGSLLALTQVFPIVHWICVLSAVRWGCDLGWITLPLQSWEFTARDMFIVAILTGGMLIVLSGLVGGIIELLVAIRLPKHDVPAEENRASGSI